MADNVNADLGGNYQAAEQLFNLLNEENFDMAGVSRVLTNNPGILSDDAFVAKLSLTDLNLIDEKNVDELSSGLSKFSQNLQNTNRVLSNLQKVASSDTVVSPDDVSAIANAHLPNGETIGTQTIKNMNYLNALQNTPHVDSSLLQKSGDVRNFAGDFLRKAYSKEEGGLGGDSKQTNKFGQRADELLKQSQADKGGTLTIDQLRMKAYQGTLTVEQAEQLKKGDDKKVAKLGNQDGDKKKDKREPSKDKFKDEDVIKYMYEDWFLGGASWLFNKTEDLILDTVDAACNQYLMRNQRLREDRQAQQDERLKAAKDKAAGFGKITEEQLNALNAECQNKAGSFKDIFKDLQDNLHNPNPQWKYYSAEDTFIKNLQANPQQAQKFIDGASKEIEKRLKGIETTGKLAMLVTSVEMVNDMMTADKKWRGKDGDYKSDDELGAELGQRSRERHRKILEAVSVISEDARLVAEISYERLAEPRPDFTKYTQEQIDKEVNGFLKDLTHRAQEANKAQREEIGKSQFDTVGKTPDSSVRSMISGMDKLIDKQISKGRVYSEELFREEMSQQRIAAKRSLYEEAVSDNSPRSIERTLNKMQEINHYSASTLEARKLNIQDRRNKLDAFKKRFEKRDGVTLSAQRFGGERNA